MHAPTVEGRPTGDSTTSKANATTLDMLAVRVDLKAARKVAQFLTRDGRRATRSTSAGGSACSGSDLDLVAQVATNRLSLVR